MKKVLSIFGLLISLSVTAQNKVDSIKVPAKKDTAFVPVYNVFDTAKGVAVYLANDGFVKHTVGFAVLHGFKQLVGTKMQWVENPKVVWYLDSKRNKLKDVLNFFQFQIDTTKKK